MPREIWLGPVLGTNRERLLARCAEYVAKGETDRLLYIAASHPLLDLATQKILDGQTARGVWGEFPFYLFRGFVRRVLSSAVSEAPPTGVPARASRTGWSIGRASSDDEPSLTVSLLRPATPRVPIDREELPLRHSLISQIIKQLAAAGRVPAIKRLANRDGCVNTVTSLIGELQRAGKTAAEFTGIVMSRAAETELEIPNSKFQIPDSKDQSPKTKAQNPETQDQSPKPKVQSPEPKVQSPKSQLDFDQDVALIYSKYEEALAQFGLTDDDADQLRALQVLRDVAQVDNSRSREEPQINNLRYSLPWLDNVDLLVLDGFFDFTPVQGEMLRLLIPQISNVIVNINHDNHNEPIFQPFQSTIEQLNSIADFTEIRNADSSPTDLRAKLFNVGQVADLRSDEIEAPQVNNLRYHLFECSDRETELRAIAKEIKRLIFESDYQLSDIALVVRERATYADAILRVFEREAVPCNLERRVAAGDIPCVRATAKLFQILKQPEREQVANPKASDIAHLIKTDYFRISEDDLRKLAKTFETEYASLLDESGNDERDASRRFALGIGRWAPDVLENVIAYVGSELRVRAWLDRAARLVRVLPSADAARSFIGAENDGDDSAVMAEVEPPPEDEPAPPAKAKRPSPVHPASIAWTTLVMEHLRQTIADLPAEGRPNDLRAALMTLLERLEFPSQVREPVTQRARDIPQVMLNVRGLEALRRALAATVRGFDFAQQVVTGARESEARAGGPLSASLTKQPSLTVGLMTRTTLAAFIDELERCLKSQVLSISAGDRDGLRILEATDVRGLRFRAMFIADMNEGSFPLRSPRDWLYPQEERERLKSHGLVLEDISNATLLKEEHYFYQCACRATERLYLTRPLAADDGIETVQSYYIEELKRAIAPAEIDRKQIRSDIDSQDLQTASHAYELAAKIVRQKARQGQRMRTENLLPPVVADELVAGARREMLLSDSLLRRVAIETERAGESFGPYDGQVTQNDLRRLLANHFGPDYVYSASGLSAFGNCPFRFFAARVLRLEPRNEAALDLPAIDAGKLLHEILRRFFERHRREYLPDASRDELIKEISAVADEVFKQHEQLVPPLNERIWKIDCEIRKLILEQVLLYELRLQEKTKTREMLPTYFELAFGRASESSDPASTSNYLPIYRDGDASSEAALIQGQIDRVDVGESGKHVMTYDYKLSQGARVIDMRAGRQLQIPIYLAALEHLFLPDFELAGGGYYRLRGRGKRLNQGLYRKMFSDCTDVTGRVMIDDARWHQVRREVGRLVWQFIDAMRAGDFRVKPSEGKKTCKFCDYAAVCRYDSYRIGRKN